MENIEMNANESDTTFIRNQLLTARNEIHNLRQQIRALANTHQQDVEKIQKQLTLYQQNSCTCSTNTPRSPSSQVAGSLGLTEGGTPNLSCPAIGVVATWFPEKKATPRQPGICIGSHGKLTLSNSVFTNPEHALEGLDGFSHMWILFHFHKNDSSHVRAKVAPPRLNGARTGVFGTRSPHRPSPIGLSLVAIDRIEGCCVYFSGADMVDGTPVLDIKPYIPQYDNPVHCCPLVASSCVAMLDLRLMDGGEEEGDLPQGDVATLQSPSRLPVAGIGEREAPDGEEGIRSLLAAPVGSSNAPKPSPGPTLPQVRVPSWINQPPVPKLTVSFSDRATAQLDSIDQNEQTVAGLRNAISCVLQEDPRSVYLREKWGNQFFTFLICTLHVSCKFDDVLHTAMVYQVKSAGKMCECGQPEWQCTIHGDAS